MPPDAPQVLGTYKKNGSCLTLVLTAVAVLGGGCEGPPARSKPWLHGRDSGPGPGGGTPGAGAAGSAVREVLAGEQASLQALAARRDTLTVWLDSDPRTLDPLVTPTEW